MVETPVTINFKRIYIDSSNCMDDLINRMRQMVHSRELDVSRDGYVLKNVEKDYVFGYYVFEYPTYTIDFDLNELEPVKVKTMKKAVIPFALDLKYNLLEVYSDKNKTFLIVNELSKLLNFNLSVDDLSFNAKRIISRIEKLGYDYKIKTIKIKDFKLNSSVIGLYSAKVADNEVGRSLIREYGNSIIYVGVSISLDSNNISLGFYESGSLRIFSKLDDSEYVIQALKEILFGDDSLCQSNKM